MSFMRLLRPVVVGFDNDSPTRSTPRVGCLGRASKPEPLPLLIVSRSPILVYCDRKRGEGWLGGGTANIDDGSRK